MEARHSYGGTGSRSAHNPRPAAQASRSTAASASALLYRT